MYNWTGSSPGAQEIGGPRGPSLSLLSYGQHFLLESQSNIYKDVKKNMVMQSDHMQQVLLCLFESGSLALM